MAYPQLAETTDLATLGIAAPAFPPSITDAIKVEHLLKASALALSYVQKQYTLPLSSWGNDLRGAVVAIATYTLMKLRGFDPENSADTLVVKAYDDAIAWLRDIAKGIAELVGVVDATPEVDDGGPLVESDTQAGWQIPVTTTTVEEW